MTTLRLDIRKVEGRLIERRHRISTALGGVARNVGNSLVSPGAIITAGLFGALLDRGSELRAWRLLTILQTANASLRLLLTMSSRSADANVEPSGYTSPSPVS